MIVYSEKIKNKRLQAVIDSIDGVKGKPGCMKIFTADGKTLLANIPLALPSFATPTSGFMVLNGTPLREPRAPRDGKAGLARIYDGNDELCIDGFTVGPAGCDIVISSQSVSINDEVVVSGGRINAR